jgi:glycosyltransferase involved in cell wall biosynthesis
VPEGQRKQIVVAHVDAERGFSGGEKQVFLLMEGLAREGVASVLFCPPGSAAESRARKVGIECRTVAMKNDLNGPAAFQLSRGFKDCGAELVHLHTGRATWLGGWGARLAKLPAITTRRMDRPVRPGWRTRLMYESLTRRTVAISRGVAECLQAGEVPGERVQTISSAVDPVALEPSRARADVRAELGAGDDDVVLLAVGALVRRKGHDVLLDALSTLEARLPLWIAGEGEERAALEARGADRARFLGRRDDVADLLHASDVVVMPSRREGLGVAALEAMAAGRPVVASQVGGLGQAVVHERTGLLVPPEDPVALAAAVDRIARDRGLRLRLGAAGPERVAEGFLASQMVAAYAALYRDVLQEWSER